MSLLQLLTVGQSLRPIKDRPSRYRMRQQSLLPKFGPAPSVGTPAPGGEPAVPAVTLAPPKDPAEAAPPPQAAASTTPVLPSGPRPTAAAVPPQPYPAGRWSIKSWSLSKRAPAAQPAKVPVQGQLSLETVRPVRNDLLDSDLEVVPAPLAGELRPRLKLTSRPAEADATQPRTPLWTWLRTRLLRRLD